MATKMGVLAALALASMVAFAGVAGAVASSVPAFTLAATIPVDRGSGPAEVAVDPSTHTVYVTNSLFTSDDGTVSVIDEMTDTVTATVTVGHDPIGVAVDPSTHQVYVANFLDGTVSVIDGTTDTVTHTIPAGARRCR